VRKQAPVVALQRAATFLRWASSIRCGPPMTCRTPCNGKRIVASWGAALARTVGRSSAPKIFGMNLEEAVVGPARRELAEVLVLRDCAGQTGDRVSRKRSKREVEVRELDDALSSLASVSGLIGYSGSASGLAPVLWMKRRCRAGRTSRHWHWKSMVEVPWQVFLVLPPNIIAP